MLAASYVTQWASVVEQTRVCNKCCQTKPLDLFAKDKRSADGRRRQCRACRNASQAAGMSDEQRERRRVWLKNYFATEIGKAVRNAANRAWRRGSKGKAYDQRADVKEKRNRKSHLYRLRNPEKTAARNAVRVAKASGRLAMPSTLRCAACGKQARDYHHHKGYAQEFHLEVIPLCRPCHFAV